jgi:hypothetical protein
MVETSKAFTLPDHISAWSSFKVYFGPIIQTIKWSVICLTFEGDCRSRAVEL